MIPGSLSLITTLLLVFTSAIVGGLIAKKLKLPMLLGYIAAGVLFGNLLPALQNTDFLKLIGDIGVVLLLFSLGIEFSMWRLRHAVKLVLWPAILQIILSIFLFLLLFWAFGFSFVPALFFATAASLSSTAIVVKLLSEKGELETVPGEATASWLVIQDISVIGLMIILPAIATAAGSSTITISSVVVALTIGFVKAIAFLAAVFIVGRHIVPPALRWIGNVGSRELFSLTTVAFIFVAAISAYVFGMPMAIGAFVAGLLIAETSQNHAMFSEIRPLRDLFIVTFFVTLGMLLPVGYIAGQLPTLLALTLVILFIKWFLVFGLSRYVGFHRKAAFLMAIALTEMSEFGFILGKEGVATGVLTQNHYAMLTTITFLTLFLAIPLIANTHAVYAWFYKTLGRLLPKLFRDSDLNISREDLQVENHIVICGYGRVGKYIGRALEMAKIPFLVVDYNHATIASLREKGITVVYGDPADKEVLDYAQVDLAKALIIAIPDRHTQEMIIGNAQTLNRRIKIICRTHHEEDQKDLKSLGVTTIIQPEFEAAVTIVEKLLSDFGVSPDDIAGKVSRLKIEHGLG